MSGNLSRAAARAAEEACWAQGVPGGDVHEAAGKLARHAVQVDMSQQAQGQQQMMQQAQFAQMRDPYTVTLRIEVGSDFLLLVLGIIVAFVLWVRFSGFAGRLAGNIADWVEARVVATSCKFVVALCEDPEVARAASKLMASGINQWLANPETQEHIRTFWTRAPDREVAAQLGRNTPLLVKSFVDGLGHQIMYQFAQRVYDDTKSLRGALGWKSSNGVAFIPSAPSC